MKKIIFFHHLIFVLVNLCCSYLGLNNKLTFTHLDKAKVIEIPCQSLDTHITIDDSKRIDFAISFVKSNSIGLSESLLFYNTKPLLSLHFFDDKKTDSFDKIGLTANSIIYETYVKNIPRTEIKHLLNQLNIPEGCLISSLARSPSYRFTEDSLKQLNDVDNIQISNIDGELLRIINDKRKIENITNIYKKVADNWQTYYTSQAPQGVILVQFFTNNKRQTATFIGYQNVSSKERVYFLSKLFGVTGKVLAKYEFKELMLTLELDETLADSNRFRNTEE